MSKDRPKARSIAPSLSGGRKQGNGFFDVGRPTKYTRALGLKICERIACGESLQRICSESEFPNRSTVLRWVQRGEEDKLKRVSSASGEAAKHSQYEQFCDTYVRARELQLHSFEDEMIDIADDARNDYMEVMTRNGLIKVLDQEHVSRSKLRLETRGRILMARHKDYKKRIDVTSGEVPIKAYVVVPGGEFQPDEL